MKMLSDYKNEEALDLLADLLEPACMIMASPGVQEVRAKGGNNVQMVSAAIKGSKKYVIQFLAILNGVPVEEYECTIPSLIVDLLRIVNDPAIQAVFQLQSQADKTSFGSATANTEANDQ